MITSLEQLNSIINQNPIYIIASNAEYIGKYGDVQEIEFTDSEELIPIIDMQMGYIITYNNINDLLDDLRNSYKHIKLTDCGDDDFFDYQPDLMLSWYQGIKLIRSHKALPAKDINTMALFCITEIQKLLHASANNKCPNDMDTFYEDLANKFIDSLPTY